MGIEVSFHEKMFSKTHEGSPLFVVSWKTFESDLNPPYLCTCLLPKRTPMGLSKHDFSPHQTCCLFHQIARFAEELSDPLFYFSHPPLPAPNNIHTSSLVWTETYCSGLPWAFPSHSWTNNCWHNGITTTSYFQILG